MHLLAELLHNKIITQVSRAGHPCPSLLPSRCRNVTAPFRFNKIEPHSGRSRSGLCFSSSTSTKSLLCDHESFFRPTREAPSLAEKRSLGCIAPRSSPSWLLAPSLPSLIRGVRLRFGVAPRGAGSVRADVYYTHCPHSSPFQGVAWNWLITLRQGSRRKHATRLIFMVGQKKITTGISAREQFMIFLLISRAYARSEI